MVSQQFQRKARFVAAIVTFALITGCGARPPKSADDSASAEPGYVPPPAVTSAIASAGQVVMTGEAPAGAQVRLANPAGGGVSGRADSNGRWAIRLSTDGQARIYGLSAIGDGRRVQAQGYLLVGPRGETALLRSGAGALRLDRAPGSRIAAVDFDADGGALVSGWAPAGTDVAFRLDGRLLGEARADADGRFSYALPRLAGGTRRIAATGVGFTDEMRVEVSPPSPLTNGPLLARPTGDDLRADWLTPGGGVQSTVLAG